MMQRDKHTFDIRALEAYIPPTAYAALLTVLIAMFLRMLMKGFSYSSLVETLVCIYTSVFLFNYGKYISNKCRKLFRRCRKRLATTD